MTREAAASPIRGANDRGAALPRLGPDGSAPSSPGRSILVGAVLGGLLGAGVGVATADCGGLLSEVCEGSAALEGAGIGVVAGALVGLVAWRVRRPATPDGTPP